MSTGWRYFSLCVNSLIQLLYHRLLTKSCRFLMAQTYAGFSIFYGWMSNTFPSPQAKRAVALAFCNSVSQVGNIGGSCVVVSPFPSTRTS